MTARNSGSNRIEEKADEVVERAGVTRPAIPVSKIARNAGIQVKPSMLGDDVSGLLVLDDGKPRIGYNEHHANVRQRFTIAHELGHFLLHDKSRELFIDKRYPATFRRDEQSSEGKCRREREANAFAAALLMPCAMIEREIDARGFDLADGSALSDLADLFEVSRQAMAFRLANSGIFGPATEYVD